MCSSLAKQYTWQDFDDEMPIVEVKKDLEVEDVLGRLVHILGISWAYPPVN